MTIVIVCIFLFVFGTGGGAIWANRGFQTPPPAAELNATEVARRYFWYVSVLVIAGVLSGVTVIGAGGRLAMRILAVTAGTEAQGKITEAEEIVGKITVDGTIGFVLFNGIFGGIVFGGLYLLLRRFLPRGRLGGVSFGLGLLVVFGSVIDPLRRENVDFDLVGPGWFAVLVFTLLAVCYGLAVAGFTARISAWLPLISKTKPVLLRYLFPIALLVVAFTLSAFLIVVAGIVILSSKSAAIAAAVRSERTLLVGRVLISLVAVASLPRSVASIIDIAGR